MQAHTHTGTISWVGALFFFEKRGWETFFVSFSESRIRYDHYLIPFTLYELGLLYKQQGDIAKATSYIENAKYVLPHTTFPPHNSCLSLFMSVRMIAIVWLCHFCSGQTTRITPWSPDYTSGSTLHSTASKDHLSALHSTRQTAPAKLRITSASQEGMTFLSMKKLESHFQQDSFLFSLQCDQPFYLKYLFVWMDEII